MQDIPHPFLSKRKDADFAEAATWDAVAIIPRSMELISGTSPLLFIASPLPSPLASPPPSPPPSLSPPPATVSPPLKAVRIQAARQ
mmetsp:Transcript_22162/g.39451  ORF Transcript_22162/g.39451 Transcript_22162/m.39451 type:complete len:86 (-) Transcript_22162:925-1182(-)